MKMKKTVPTILLLATWTAGHPLAAEPSTRTSAEVKHLLDYLEQSGCQFNRNGSWYDAKAARKHLQDKADYLDGKKLIGKAEDFIEKGATESSVSGKPYQVKCGSGARCRALSGYRKSWRAIVRLVRNNIQVLGLPILALL